MWRETIKRQSKATHSLIECKVSRQLLLRCENVKDKIDDFWKGKYTRTVPEEKFEFPEAKSVREISESSHMNSILEHVGYVRLRDDVDTEFENEAELLFADIEFRPTDTEEETQIKEQQLEIYIQTLERRKEIKTFFLNEYPHEVFNERKIKNASDRAAYKKFKPFARFLKAEEFKELLSY